MARKFYRRLIANLGDVNPFAHGGFFIYERSDRHGDEEIGEVLRDALYEGDCNAVNELRSQMELTYEGRYWDPPDNKTVLVASFTIEPDVRKDLDWIDDWRGIMESMDISAALLKEAFTAPDPRVRAEVYRLVGDYHGWENIDSYPDTFTRQLLKKRFAADLDELDTYGNCLPRPNHG